MIQDFNIENNKMNYSVEDPDLDYSIEDKGDIASLVNENLDK